MSFYGNLCALPCLDDKWLNVDLIGALRSIEDSAVLYNHLLQDNELSQTPLKGVENDLGNIAYLSDVGKFYCGVEKTSCSCCPGYCLANTCGCNSCQRLSADSAGNASKKICSENQLSSQLTSENLIESWLWDCIPSKERKTTARMSLLNEQREISLQAAGSCLFAIHLRQRLLIYNRYFVALSRAKPPTKSDTNAPNNAELKLRRFSSIEATNRLEIDRSVLGLGLARVGTRAALNFSFAFLRRAWRSGEDTELCSELLTEALESLHGLPEASLFNSGEISPLWIEVLERSIKFLRQVVLGDIMGTRCNVPREDRHTALNLLLELGIQKGNLGSALEGVLLLLNLWEKDKDTEDNRTLPKNQGAPLVNILRRFQKINQNYGLGALGEINASNPTESFLRFLTIPESDSDLIDLKQAAVMIISHLDRLVKPHLMSGNFNISASPHSTPSSSSQAQQVFTLGWLSLNCENYGYSRDVCVNQGTCVMGQQYTATVLKLPMDLCIAQMVCSEGTIHILTTKGELFAMNATSASETVNPQLVEGFGTVPVIKVASHWEGCHYLALNAEQQVYSWGSGEGGRLGHGDSQPRENPTRIAYFVDKSIVNIFCGTAYSAAIGINGELYTWGRGTYRRLGHDTSDDKLIPTIVNFLVGQRVKDMALGTGDAHTLCVTESGIVYAWGDGDYGKLGTGFNGNCQAPTVVEGLTKVSRVFSGAQFSVALTEDGFVYTWGNGNGGRLGHGLGMNHCNVPRIVEGLQGRVIVDIAVGSAHCLALTSSGEVFGWGRNDYQQVCPSSICRDPIIAAPIMTTPLSMKLAGIACGAAYSIVWCHSSMLGLPMRIPFVVDLTEHTFRLLDQLLGIVMGSATSNDLHYPPNQESECIAVACLNLLRLQLHALIMNNVSPKSVGLGEGSRLLGSLKTRILNLAGGPVILKTIQDSAQATLQIGWSVLLPTASERAQTLTSLLPTGVDSNVSTAGHRFMTDLLVGSLMAEGGLQIALNQVINCEPENTSNSHNLPLLHLIKQLLKNNSALTQVRLNQLLIEQYSKTTHDGFIALTEQPSPSLDLLHRFQRLLLSRIYNSKKLEEIQGAEGLLGKYLYNVIKFSLATIHKAYEVSLQKTDGIAEILKSDISDTLLYELLIGLVLIHKDCPLILTSFEWINVFTPLLTALDSLNRVLCENEIQDADDMGWPAILCRGAQKQPSAPAPNENYIIRKTDLENHNLSGGQWIVFNGYVCNIEGYECDNTITSDFLRQFVGKDISGEANLLQHRSILEHIVAHFKVGKFGLSDCSEKVPKFSIPYITHFRSQSTLAYLLGLRSNLLQMGIPQQPAEIQCKSLLNSAILSGGLQVLQPSNPFDEEKGEARSSTSTAGSTPTESSNQIPIQNMPQINCWPLSRINQRVDSLLTGLGESRLTDPLVLAWLTISERYCKENNLIWYQDYPPEHPIQEFDRLLTAVLLRHQSLGPLVLAVVDSELSDINLTTKLPNSLAEIVKIVNQTKWVLIRTRQQLNRSYKEVCAPILDKCRFLLYEVRPAVSTEQSAFNRLCILYKQPRFRTVVHRIINEMRTAKKQLECAKPEDILNVTIQSQHTAIKIGTPENVEKGSSDNLDGLLTPEKNVPSDNLVDAAEDLISEKKTSNVDDAKTPTNEKNGNFVRRKEDCESAEQFISNVITKLSEKSIQNSKANPASENIASEIVQFVTQDTCDVETLRRAMFCQVQRYQVRKQGLEMFSEILKYTQLLDAVQYNILNGYLGLFLSKPEQVYCGNVLDDLNLITAYQKADIILTHAKIMEWSIKEIQNFVSQEQIYEKQKHHGDKDNSNLGTYVFLKKLSRARFLLNVFGIIAKDLGANELSFLINSGALGCILGLLRQMGGDITTTKCGSELSVVYEDTILKQKTARANLTGPEMAKLMKIGTRIVRGTDWKWGDQDGPMPGEGRIISELGEDGWVRVEWDTGATNSYRMGKEGQYDLRLADSLSSIVSPDSESEKEELFNEIILSGDSHPTKLLRHSCLKMLQIFSVGVGQHGDTMQKSAVFGLASMFRAILSTKTGFQTLGFEHWTTLGFLRAIASSKELTHYLTSEPWIALHIDILNSPNEKETDVYKKIQSLRLLQATLVNWTTANQDRMMPLIEKLFHGLGKTIVLCCNDSSLIQNPSDLQSRVLVSASYSGTIAEEIILLLRKLHSIPIWNTTINEFLSEKLCIAADLFTQDSFEEEIDDEKIHIVGALSLIGGSDPRPRLGSHVNIDGNFGTIIRFTNKGKAVVSLHASGDIKKLSMSTVKDSLEVIYFNLSRFPINEMLVNSWAMLLYGPGERRYTASGKIDICLLRSQQIQLASISATRVLFKNQCILRKILQQRTRGVSRCSSDDSLSEEGNARDSSEELHEADEKPEDELLIQNILIRATQPSPVKACYSYNELYLAALSISQMLASNVHAHTMGSCIQDNFPPPVQTTLIHGVPLYNNTTNKDNSVGKKNPPSTLVQQIMEMGISRRAIEYAISQLTAKSDIPPNADQVVLWLFEHDSTMSTSGTEGATSIDYLTVNTESDTESAVSDTQDWSSITQDVPTKYALREDFKTADQYAIYVRGHICPGMTVRCIRDFEDIRVGDIGTVLKVDTEGLHDLNVQVDWMMHGNTYWMCFLHLELMVPPPPREIPTPAQVTSSALQQITVGMHVSLKKSITVSFAKGKTRVLPKGTVGTVWTISGQEVSVEFPGNLQWTGLMSDFEITQAEPSRLHLFDCNEEELTDDWSKCIKSLTVSSNETAAKHLLDKSPNCWQSIGSQGGKHWIRLEMHDKMLVHSLSITVSSADNSHMPSLVVVRVGDTIAGLKELTWVSVKITDTVVPLLTALKQFYPFIEIVIKQCRNNGIHCKVHSINIIGQKQQTDLDLMLLNASFLASEYDIVAGENRLSSYTNAPEDKNNRDHFQCKVLVWGLNDKEQLGGLKGSKVKVPTFSPVLSQLNPIHISGGSKSLFVVSQDGKVYACGEGTNGRLGLGHNCNVSTPRQIPVLSQYVVKKVAVHSGGKHALALTLDGKVFSFGEGEDGKLGHGNRMTLDKPKLIEALRSKRIRDVACGSSHSAAISSSGELYTWGLGEYGRLGHGDNSTQLKPKLVAALLGHRVVQVACGSRDAQTLALTEEGLVFSWGDGDFGKLGRGGSEGCSLPQQIERLNGVGVTQIECGAQFSLALTSNGEVWTWGKGDYFRLGHGSDQHIRKPTPIQGLRGKKIIHVAVGALHCLAVTDTGQVFAWGDNDHGQQGSGNTTVNKKPYSVVGLEGVFVNRVACGSSHSIAWCLPQSPAEEDKKEPIAFGINKDPLGSNSLGIYDTDSQLTNSTISKSQSRKSLSEIVLSIESFGARQMALNYILNSLSILQARQAIISALTSHSQPNIVNTEKSLLESCEEASKESSEPTAARTIVQDSVHEQDTIAHGGGEAPAELTAPDVSPDNDLVLVNANPQNGPLSTFQTLTGSMSQSGSISSCNVTQRHSKMSASAMSVMAATMTHQDEMVHATNTLELDDITCLLGEPEAKSLVELLKLSVAGRCGNANASETIANTLITLGANSPVIGSMLLETCITELEDLCTSRHCLGKIPKPVVQESCHPYIDDVTLVGHVKIPGAESLRIEFDSQCSTEKRNDPLVIMDGFCRVIATRSGREYAQWAPEIRIPGDEMRWKFISDSSVNGWGWRFWVHAIMPSSFLQELCPDRAVLSQPSMDLVMALLDSRLCVQISSVFLRLTASLASCAQLSTLTCVQRIWALKKLHEVLTSKMAPKSCQDPNIVAILTPLIPVLLRQYEYEEPQVRGGIHLMHSEYFKTLAELACDMQLDSSLPPIDSHKWSWFRRYCTAVRVAQSLIRRTQLPQHFCMEIRKKLAEMNPNPPSGASTSLLSVSSASSLSGSVNIQYIDSVSPTPPPPPPAFLDIEKGLSMGEREQYLHEDHNVFKIQHDSQLLQWLNRRPEDWALSWGGASTIYGWGHNHRGQLGGLDGGRIKAPAPCEALSLLRPVQLAGGEQTLYAVTADGKLFATGYGAGGRLGIGGSESVSTPTLVESLQHVFVKKVAVNSGGKHCLALTSDGEVYSWGEGEDGKLGHGNRLSYDRPKLIEALSGVGVVDIACGSAHSACITSQGLVLTWGKGRYGRLGLGDSEDQTRPKMVEALLGYRAIDIACGSGDAQTLCITDDDNVWSWGDGDYGKLGRGGSDGCKVPMKIESLAGLGVVKVECGSQFSVALTRSGAVYTWGKGDYHRLGHGSVDHVRRPKKIATLQGKKIISIATGSLHCVACSDQGEVFTWGDNDEGQLGDGTVSAIPRPRLVTALQGKHIVKVTCGSAHTLALSTSQLNEGCRPPPLPPLEYDLCRDLPPDALHARLVLLHHFSELICPCLAMLPISGILSLSSLKDLLVYSIKEATFRKVIQTTMVRDKQHGPVIELNRIQVKRSRIKSGGGLAGTDGMKSVFGQMVHKLPLLTQEALSLPHRVWKVKFVGESVDDCGGGYSESIAEMCDELQNGSVPLLIQTPNGRGEAGANRDCFLLDPTLTTVLQMNMFRFLGVLMGIAVRTGSPLSLNLAEPVWRQLSGEILRPADLTEIDRDYVAGLLCIRDMDDDPKVFDTLELPFATPSAKGHEISLSTRYIKITPQNRHEYIKLALSYRLHEFDEQVKAVRDGMSKVIPVPLLSLFSASELQAMVCGSPDIPLGLLKSVASYKGVEATSNLVTWFWEVMEEFSNQERSLFLRFVWGRTRLPRTIADFRGRDFVLQVLDKYNPPDNFLPESYTCFFLLKMPRYTCKAILQEKLKYAIHFCKSIDSDEYARVAIGEPTETTGSEDSDIESVASHNFFN